MARANSRRVQFIEWARTIMYPAQRVGPSPWPGARAPHRPSILRPCGSMQVRPAQTASQWRFIPERDQRYGCKLLPRRRMTAQTAHTLVADVDTGGFSRQTGKVEAVERPSRVTPYTASPPGHIDNTALGFAIRVVESITGTFGAMARQRSNPPPHPPSER